MSPPAPTAPVGLGQSPNVQEGAYTPFKRGWSAGRRRCWGGLAVAVLSLSAGCGDDPQDPLPPPAVVGSVEVTWRLENANGESVDCSTLNLTGAEVRLGGEPVDVSCGEPQTARFTDLLPGRYPVLIRLFVAGAVLREHVGNVVVMDQGEVQYDHAFLVDQSQFGTGSMEVRWFIDGQLPGSQCAIAGGEDVIIQLLEGPQSDVEVTRPCAEGTVTIDDLRQGSYRVLVTMSNADGFVGFPTLIRSAPVTQNTVEVVNVDIVTMLPVGGDLVCRWTVNSSVAIDGCAGLPPNFVEVSIRTDVSQSVTIATATAACEQGELLMTDLPVGRSSEGAGLRATFRLIETSVGRRALDTQIARDIVLLPSMTSSTSANFEIP